MGWNPVRSALAEDRRQAVTSALAPPGAFHPHHLVLAPQLRRNGSASLPVEHLAHQVLGPAAPLPLRGSAGLSDRPAVLPPF